MEGATHRNWYIVRRIACVQFSFKPQHSVGGVLVAMQQEIVLRRVDNWFTVRAVLLYVTVLQSKQEEEMMMRKGKRQKQLVSLVMWLMVVGG